MMPLVYPRPARAMPLPRSADVCLVLEGSYPFIRGGVAEWAHRLIASLPERTFHLLSIIPGDRPAVPVYDLPANVTGLTVVPLFGPFRSVPGEPDSPALWNALESFYDPRVPAAASSELLFERIGRELAFSRPGVSEDLLFSERAFDLLVRIYEERAPGSSFLDFLYTVLFSHLPIAKLLAEPLPAAGVYHAACTGYAGFLAARAHRLTGRPMFLTEHGIYTIEREIEILLADWIYSRPLEHISMIPEAMNLKRVWVDVFRFLGRLAYQEAERIFTLFPGNAAIQKRLGAAPDKLQLIPNGVDIGRFRPAAGPRAAHPPQVSLIGRVVAIKDIRTLIRACRIVHDSRPEVHFSVVGPTGEEEAYFLKCLDYRRLLGLESVLSFTGEMDPVAAYAGCDIAVLTSISEGQPLVVLEAMASGIPVVTTRVGACPELILGATAEDRELGAAGVVVDIGDHRAVAWAILSLLADPERAHAMGAAGRRRVEARYDHVRVAERYGAAYAEALGTGPAAGAGYAEEARH